MFYKFDKKSDDKSLKSDDFFPMPDKEDQSLEFMMIDAQKELRAHVQIRKELAIRYDEVYRKNKQDPVLSEITDESARLAQHVAELHKVIGGLNGSVSAYAALTQARQSHTPVLPVPQSQPKP